MDNEPAELNRQRRILQCASCDAMVVAEVNDHRHPAAATVCALCGMAMTELAIEGVDYFDVVMRAGRRSGRAARFRKDR